MIPLSDHTPSDTIDDCWNRIGVFGNQQCEKLSRHVHCRNCEVYAAAAQRILQRPVSEAYKREWTNQFSQAEKALDNSDSSIMVFRIGHEWLALPSRIFVMVAPHAKAHKLPHRHEPGLAGIVNVSGKLYPCVLLSVLLGIDDTEQITQTGKHEFPRLLVVQFEDQAFAIPVPHLLGIVRYAASNLQTPATTINKGTARFLSGVVSHDGMHIGCLDASLIGNHLKRLIR